MWLLYTLEPTSFLKLTMTGSYAEHLNAGFRVGNPAVQTITYSHIELNWVQYILNTFCCSKLMRQLRGEEHHYSCWRSLADRALLLFTRGGCVNCSYILVTHTHTYRDTSFKLLHINSTVNVFCFFVFFPIFISFQSVLIVWLYFGDMNINLLGLNSFLVVSHHESLNYG